MTYLTAPRGVVPRAQDCNLGPEYAALAENIRLRHGRWEPWKTPKAVLHLPEDAIHAHVRDCCWTASDDCYSIYTDAGACEQTYHTRPGRRPEVSAELCTTDWRFLGLPIPDPIAVSTVSTDCVSCEYTDEPVSYVITYCSECEEGAPSCPAQLELIPKDSQAVIAFPPAPDPMWGVTHVNIYRLKGLWDSSQGLMDMSNPNALVGGFTSPITGSQFFRVGQVPISEEYFVDRGDHLGQTLTTEDFYPPAEGLQIGGETASGSLVGWIDNEVWFSERNAYHAWPIKARFNFPHEVKRVCTCNDLVYVLTDGQAYVIEDSAECRDSTCRPVREAKDSYPICSQRSCVVLPNGVLYASIDGLVLLTADASSLVVSGLAFAKDDWHALGPNTIQIEKAENYLFLLTDQVFFVWSLSFDESGQLPADLTTLDFLPDSLIIDDEDHLFFTLDGTVYEFDAGDDYMTMRWRQATQDNGTETLVTAMRGQYLNRKTHSLNFISFYQSKRRVLRRELTHKGFRFRSRLGCDFQVEVIGKEPLCGLYYGVGFSDLARQ